MLHNQLTRAPPEDEVKAIFLAALQEPVQTMLAVLDFRTRSLTGCLRWIGPRTIIIWGPFNVHYPRRRNFGSGRQFNAQHVLNLAIPPWNAPCGHNIYCVTQRHILWTNANTTY